jgi:hypothetical protein
VTPDLLSEARRLMPGLEWREWTDTSIRAEVGEAWTCLWQPPGVTRSYMALLTGFRRFSSGPTPEAALLDLRAQVETYLRGRNRPPQRRADCERWLAAWRTP